MEFYRNNNWKSLKINNEDILVPKDWDLKAFKDISNKIGDGLHGTPKYTEDSTYFFINGNNLRNGEIVLDENTKKISKEEYLKYKKEFNENTIFISINGTIGSLSFYKNEPVILGKSVGYVNLKVNENNIFIYYFLKSQQFEKSLGFDLTGSTIKNLSLASLRNTKLFYPSEVEQNAIASILSSQELIIQKTKDLIANIEKRNQFMINELLSGHLRIKEENEKTIFYKNPDDNWQSLKMNGENVEIPKDWNKSNLKKQSKIQSEKPKSNLQYLEIGDIDVKTKKYNLEAKEKTKASAMKFVPSNTLLISTVRPTRLGFTVTKEDLNVSSAFVKITSEIQDFLTFQLYTIDYLKFLESNQNGATYPTIKEDILLSFEFGMPSENEVKLISTVLKELFIEKQKYEQILKKEEKTFTFLLEELMSGRLRIKV